MDDLDKLPADLVWQQDGHLSDIVLSTIADGEMAIVPLEAHSHLEHCDECTTRFGAEALLSVHAAELLAEVSRVPEVSQSAQSSRAPVLAMPRSVREAAIDGLARLPKPAFFGALFLAAMGAVPALISRGPWHFADIAQVFGRSIVMLARSMVLVAKSGSFTVLLWASAMTLLLLGLVVSRSSRTTRSSLEVVS